MKKDSDDLDIVFGRKKDLNKEVKPKAYVDEDLNEVSGTRTDLPKHHYFEEEESFDSEDVRENLGRVNIFEEEILDESDDMEEPMAKLPKSKKKNKKKSDISTGLKVQRVIASILIVALTLGVVGTAGIWVFVADSWRKSPQMYPEDFNGNNTTVIFDDQNEIIQTTGAKKSDAITYNELPQVLVDALIATEDSRFFGHNGVDVPRFTKAMMVNVKDSLTRFRLSFSQGGSTLTMQIIKNTYFMSENVETGEGSLAASSGIEGVRRKMQELSMAQTLEKDKMLTKKEQIAFYLNTINFGAGNNTQGIQSSTQRYFNKDVSELNLIESAFLAGVINAPTAYSPYRSIRKAKERTHTILDLMFLHGYITESERDVAKAIDIENIFVDHSQTGDDSLANQAYLDMVYEEVEELTGLKINSVPMKIYTNMNSNVQKEIDKVQNREVSGLNPVDKNAQMGSVVLENGTGRIVGVFGGYDYNQAKAFNRAKSAKAQPASVVKALLSYPLAFEHLGISSDHVVTDAPYVFAGMSADKDGQVNNYDNVYKGDMLLKDAFANSRNTTALTLLESVQDKIGSQAILDYMRNIGLADLDKFDVQYGIGGSTLEVTPLQLAESLSTIINKGEYVKSSTINRIEFLNGQEPVVNEPKGTQVLSEGAAYLTTELMQHAVSSSYSGYLTPTRRSYPVFGKTGTNQWSLVQSKNKGYPDRAPKNRDLLTATDRFSIATWIGYDEENADYKAYMSDALTQQNVQGNYHNYILKVLEKEYGPGKAIERPSDIVDIKHILGPFPYQRPLDGMKDSMVVTGKILKQYLDLTDPTPQSLDSLKDASVEYSQLGLKVDANVTLDPYADESKLTVAPDTQEMKLRGTDKVYTGKRMYDDSWLYGAVEYVVDVVVDGQVVNTLRSGHNVVGVSVNVPRGSTLQLCAYYGYENMISVESNKICNDIKLDNAVDESSLLQLPAAGSDIANFKKSANDKGVAYSLVPTLSDDFNQFGKVIKVVDGKDKDYTGQQLSADEAKALGLKVHVNDYKYDLAVSPTTVGKFYDDYSRWIQIKEPTQEERAQALTHFNGDESKTSIEMLKDYYTGNQLKLN